MNLDDAYKAQHNFFLSNGTESIAFRRQQLKKLKLLIKQNETQLIEAVYKDFKKPEFETYLTELAFIYLEINKALKHLTQWTAVKRVKTSLMAWPGRSFISPEPYGTVLIIGPWNYPYQLVLLPLVSAIAAGNTCIIKPSELALNASHALASIINQNFDYAFIYVCEGDSEITQQLLKRKFDKIFFTGSTSVGTIVAQAAAQNVTPVTLELGGKSPCWVFADTNLKKTAQRLVWGKFLNAGQTCIAPDYLLVEQSIYEPMIKALQQQIQLMFGTKPQYSSNYSRIINDKHLKRLLQLIDPSKIAIGGRVIAKEMYLEPTVLRDISFDDPIMKEELFGPILPVIPFENLDKMIVTLKKCSKPLALYVFSKNKTIQNRLINDLSFGTACINDVVMQISNSYLPFGGVGASGMGSYHGEAGFKCFSHYKSILKKSFIMDLPFRYAPYTTLKLKIIRYLFK